MNKTFTLLLFAFISAIAFAQNNALQFDGVDDYVEINAPDLAAGTYVLYLESNGKILLCSTPQKQ